MATSYDTVCTTLSQEGRIYQLEYAEKAIENSSTVMGIVFKDGVLLLSEKIKQSKAIVSGSNPTIYSVSPSIGLAICGLLPDGRNIVSRAKLEASNYLKTFGIEISGKILAERLGIYFHAHTCHWGVRPFGCCIMLSSVDKDGYHLYMLETSGNFYEYYNCGNGKGRQYVKGEVEKDNFAIRNKTVKDGLSDALKIIMKSFEGEKDTEYDVSVISSETNGKHRMVDRKIVTDLVNQFKGEIDEQRKKMELDK